MGMVELATVERNIEKMRMLYGRAEDLASGKAASDDPDVQEFQTFIQISQLYRDTKRLLRNIKDEPSLFKARRFEKELEELSPVIIGDKE